MKREFIKDRSMIHIHQYLRRIKAKLIRMQPRDIGGGREAYVVLYILT